MITVVGTLCIDEKMNYIQKVKESANAIWGAEAAAEFSDHIEQTAAAVYAVHNILLTRESNRLRR